MSSKLVDGELQLNAIYSSLKSFIQALETYMSSNCVKLHRSDSHKINYNKMQPEFVDEVINKFVYSNMTYTCQFNRRKSRAKNISLNFPKENCKFKIVIYLTNDFKYLKVTRMNDPSDHNHPLNSELPKSIPLPIIEKGGQTEHMINVIQHLSEQRRSGQFCDTIIMTRGGGKLFAHSSVLGVACPRLGVYLNKYPIFNSLHNNIDMTRYGMEEVQSLLNFFYEGCLNMNLIDKILPLAADLGVSFNIQGDVKRTQNSQKNTEQILPINRRKNATSVLAKSKSKAKPKNKKRSAPKVVSNSKKPVKMHRPKRIVGPYRCGDCGKMNQNRRELLLHKLVYCPLSMFRIKEYCCKVCDAACKNIPTLHNHMNVSHGVKKAKFKCQRCKFSYFYKRNMISHQNKNNCKQSIGTNKDQTVNNCGEKASNDPPLHIRICKDSTGQPTSRMTEYSVNCIDTSLTGHDKNVVPKKDIYNDQASRDMMIIDESKKDIYNDQASSEDMMINDGAIEGEHNNLSTDAVDENNKSCLNVERNTSLIDDEDDVKIDDAMMISDDRSSIDNSICDDQSIRLLSLDNNAVEIGLTAGIVDVDAKSSDGLIVPTPVSNMSPSSSHTGQNIVDNSDYIDLKLNLQTLEDNLLANENLSNYNNTLQLNREVNISPRNMNLGKLHENKIGRNNDEEILKVNEFIDPLLIEKDVDYLGNYSDNKTIDLPSSSLTREDIDENCSSEKSTNGDINIGQKDDEVFLNDKCSDIDRDIDITRRRDDSIDDLFENANE